LNKTIGFISLGCAKNLTDTETMLGLSDRAGYTVTADPSDADVLVVNTCAFIDDAKEESIGALFEMADYKQNGKCELLIATGCLAQRYGEELLQEMPEVDVILGTNDFDKIVKVVDAFYAKGDKCSHVSDANAHITTEGLPRVLTTPHYTAYLKIADGCDNRCTYCVIPALRGKFRSRPEGEILAEARELAQNGVKELILVAQDTAYYGKDEGEYRLPQLLDALCEIDGLEWIRLQYCYPENITDALVGTIARQKKIVKYIDMPLQHISAGVLKRMGRRSRRAQVEDLLARLRERIPSLAIRTSLIVGFPGESEEEFQELYDFLGQARLDKVGVFAYSCEEGTRASEMPDQIADEEKVRRRDRLMALQQEISLQINTEKINRTVPVLIEGYDEDDFCYVGRSYADTPEVDGAAYVYSAEPLEAGDIVQMRILDAQDYDITGEVTHESAE